MSFSFFLSGLHCHLSDLSELPPEQRFLLLLAGESLPFSFFLEKEPSSTFFFVLVAFFIRIIRACCRASTASTSQLSRAQSSLHKAETQARTDQSATTQASRQSWRKPACRRAFIQFAVFSKRTKKSKIARPTKIYNLQSNLAGATREIFDCISTLDCSFSPSFLCSSYVYAASRLFSWSMELLAFASRQFSPKIVDLSVGFTLILFYSCERA